MTKSFAVHKEGKFFFSTGETAVIAGRVVNEYTEVAFRTRKDADAHAARWNRINAESVADVAIVKAHRLSIIADYCATRAARKPAQFGLNF